MRRGSDRSPVYAVALISVAISMLVPWSVWSAGIGAVEDAAHDSTGHETHANGKGCPNIFANELRIWTDWQFQESTDFALSSLGRSAFQLPTTSADKQARVPIDLTRRSAPPPAAAADTADA